MKPEDQIAEHLLAALTQWVVEHPEHRRDTVRGAVCLVSRLVMLLPTAEHRQAVLEMVREGLDDIDPMVKPPQDDAN